MRQLLGLQCNGIQNITDGLVEEGIDVFTPHVINVVEGCLVDHLEVWQFTFENFNTRLTGKCVNFTPK